MGTVMVKISHLQAGTWDCNGKGRLTRGNGVVQNEGMCKTDNYAQNQGTC